MIPDYGAHAIIHEPRLDAPFDGGIASRTDNLPPPTGTKRGTKYRQARKRSVRTFTDVTTVGLATPYVIRS